MALIVSFNEDEKALYAELTPDQEPVVLTPAHVQEKLVAMGYHCLKLDPMIVNTLCGAAQQNQPLKLLIKKLIDATFELDIAADKLSALLTIRQADGGSELQFDELRHQLVDAGLDAELVDWSLVKQLLERGECKSQKIAKAILPKPGIDAIYIPLVQSEIEEAPQVDEQGVADMMSGHHFTIVSVGDKLMRKEPATAGFPGKDVTGTELKSIPGKDPGFTKNMQGAELSPQDPNLLIAAIKGHPIIMKNGVCVDPVLHVDTVDVSTGNIEFDGSLEVRGDVAAGMQINVTGDVVVKGVIERSIVKAGNDIVVRGGVFGLDGLDFDSEDEAQKFMLYAQGNIDASFVSSAAIKAEGDVIVKQYIGNSLVVAGNQLLLGQQGGKGILFGGLARARYFAAVTQLGNESYLETKLIVGEYHLLMQQLVSLKKTLATRQKEAEQLQEILEKVERQKNVKLGKVALDKTQRISNTINAIREKVAELKAKISEIAIGLSQHKDAHVVVSKKIHPNASLSINGAVIVFKEQQRGDTWRASGDKLFRDSEKE